MRLRRVKWPKDYAAMAVYLAIAAVLFFWEPLFVWSPDAILAGGDMATMFAPWLNFVFDVLRQYHALPLWNPYLFGGTPFYANPQPMLFYPFTYLGLAMPLVRAVALTLVIHVWLAGLGMYGWLRALGATHAGAALAGLAFAFSGAFAVRVGAGHYGIALQLAWWPLSFWMLQTAFDRRSWRRAVLSGAPLAMALLSGHTATCLLLYVAIGVYALFTQYAVRSTHHALRSNLHILALTAVAVGMSLALAAVQYLPLLTFTQLSVRASDPSPVFASRFSLPIGQLVALFVPDFFGEPLRTGYWGAEGYEEITYYVGLLMLLLALAGARLRQPRVMFFLALALGAVLLQLGADGVLFTLFYRFVPGFALTRAPGRAGLIYTFALLTAAGLTWSEIERAGPQGAQQWLGLFNKKLVGMISMLAGGAILAAYIFHATFRDTTPAAWPWHLAGQLTRFLVLFWGCMALLAAWKNRALAQRAISLLAALMVLFDLWSFGAKNIRAGEDSLAGAWSSVAAFMQQQPAARVAAEEMHIFQLNGALAYRLRSHYGYDPLVLARYQALLDAIPSYFDHGYDLLNIGFVITRNPITFQAEPPPFELALEVEGTRIYRRLTALPRAYVVHTVQVEADDRQALALLSAPDFPISRTVILPAAPPCALAPASGEGESAQVLSESPNHLELSTQSDAAGLLVLSEMYYPGWEASVDGQPVQVLRADTTLRAVCLPAGAHRVRFEFRPRDLTLGAIISGAALGLLVLVALAAKQDAPNHAHDAHNERAPERGPEPLHAVRQSQRIGQG